MESISTQVIVAFIFGVIFVVTLLVLAIKFPNPTSFQYSTFRIILSLASAGVGAMIPGFINVEVSITTKLLISAGGALAVFVIVYFFNPAKLAHQPPNEPVLPPIPEKLPDGTPFPTDHRKAFFKVWKSLLLLEQAGENLWQEVSDQTLSAFTSIFTDTQELVKNYAIFFSVEDYDALQDILDAADFYIKGKTNLMEFRKMLGTTNSKQRQKFIDDRVERQIQQNKRWLTRYKNLLKKIRASFHTTVVSNAAA